MRIEFDPGKRDRTFAERGLDFADAAIVFDGRERTAEDERRDYPERRFVTYGPLRGRMVVVVWTPIGDRRRLISLRNPNGREQARTATEWSDPDDAPELGDEFFEHASYSIGGVVVRPATGVLMRDGVRPIGRPPLGDKVRQPVTMRLPPHVLDYFRGTGPGWQRRIAEVLEAHVARTTG